MLARWLITYYSVCMMVDIVSKGIVYMNFFIVVLMTVVGLPQIVIYTSLFWGACGHMAIPICEEQFDLELPSIWKYRHLIGLGIVYTIIL